MHAELCASQSLPNFLIAGAAKAGTTTLYNWLHQHPEAFVTSMKEPFYFCPLPTCCNGPREESIERITDWEEYQALFQNGRSFRARGEASPLYLYYPESPQHIHSVIPDCKIVILLRNPIERAYSAYMHLVRDMKESLDFEESLQLEEKRLQNNWHPVWGFKALGLYANQVRRFMQTFPSRNVGIWLFEEMIQNPSLTFKEICNFLEIDSSFTPNFKAFNVSGRPRYSFLSSFIRKPNLIKTGIKTFFPNSIVDALHSFAPYVERSNLIKERMSPQIRSVLADYFKPDINELAGMLPEKNVRSWIQPNPEEVDCT